MGKKAFLNDVVVVPRLKEAPPRAILVLPLVMVEEPREVVFLPLVMDELPMAILVLSLLILVFPRERAVLPSVMLVLPIVGDEGVCRTRVRWWILGFTPRNASHTHAAHPALQALGVIVTGCRSEDRTRMLSVDSASPVAHNALVELVDVGSGRPHTTHVSP